MKPLATSLPTLDTERLRLRAMTPHDAGDLFGIYGDAETMRFASDDVFAHRSMVLDLLMSVARHLAAGTSIEWGIELRSPSRLIGTCGLHGFDPATRSAEVGCMLNRERWGHGYMREALGSLIHHARHALELAELRADIDAENGRSLRLFHALGFEKAGACHTLTLLPHDAPLPHRHPDRHPR